jgi:hypothetical protein
MEIFIDILYLIGLALGGFIGWIILIDYWMKIRKFAPEAPILAKCRKKQLPVIEVMGGGRISLIAGEKKNRGDLSFKDTTYGIAIDQRILGRDTPLMAKGGLQWTHYSTKFPFAVTEKSTRSLIAIIDMVRKNHPELDFLIDIDIIALLGTPRTDLEHDCKNYIDEQDPQMDVGTLVGTIETVQDEAAVLPPKTGFFSFAEGVQLNPSVFLSQDVRVIIASIRAQVAAEHTNTMNDIVKYGLAAMFVFVGAGVFLRMADVI